MFSKYILKSFIVSIVFLLFPITCHRLAIGGEKNKKEKSRKRVKVKHFNTLIFYHFNALSFQHFFMKEEKLKALLAIVIENYIDKGDPIWSKFLYSLEDTEYAPSTLRKYLHILEEEWLLYQPYHSAGRLPTVKWLESYLDTVLAVDDEEEDNVHVDLNYARDDLRSIVETFGDYTDGAVVWFLKEDEYYYLWLNNLLKESLIDDHETTRYIIKFIESKEIILKLDRKLTKRENIYYTFIENSDKLISIVYTKLEVNGYDAMIAILWPSRMNHKKNIAVLRKFLEECS